MKRLLTTLIISIIAITSILIPRNSVAVPATIPVATAWKVLGQSMLPTLKAGDVVITIPTIEPQLGDIVIFRTVNPASTIVHRVTSKGYDAFGWYVLTKGDNNPMPDFILLRQEHVVGIVVGNLKYTP